MTPEDSSKARFVGGEASDAGLELGVTWGRGRLFGVDGQVGAREEEEKDEEEEEEEVTRELDEEDT